MRDKPEQMEALNVALDRDRAERGCENDAEYALTLGTSAKQISFWRTGRWTALDAILIAILTHSPVAEPDASFDSPPILV